MTGAAPRIDLRPDHWAIVRDILRRHAPGRKVLAFGSRANWTAKPYSDLDLAIRGEEPLSLDALSALREAFTESDLPFRVDLLVWDDLPESFRRRIEADHVVLAEAGGHERSAPEGCREAILGDCAVVNDATYSPAEAWPFVNYLETGDIVENRISTIRRLEPGTDKLPARARRKARPGDIVYSTVRPNQRHFGMLKEVPENFLASTGFAVVRGRDGIADTGFVYRYLAQDRIVEHLQTLAEHSTSAYPSIRPADIEGLRLHLPPLDEQRAIARVLGALDDRIELNRRMGETLEAMAQALFKSWFVDFDPVRARMEGRDPGLPPPLAALFPNRLVPSELGEIPEGWTTGRLGEIASAPRRGANPAALPPKTPYIGLEHMPRRSVALTDWGRVGDVTSNKSAFEKGDILFGKLRPYFHKVGIAPVAGVCSTDIVVVVPNAAEWGAFALACMSSDAFVAYTDRASTGTKMPRTSWTAMARYPLRLPPEPLARAFENAIKPLLSRIAANTRQSRALAAQRDALSPKLVSGTIRLAGM